MIVSKRNCKVCEEEYNAIHISQWHGIELPIDGWHCHKCKSYDVAFDEDGSIETETISSGNYRLIFFAQYEQASIVEKDLESKARDAWRKVKNIELKALTHEVALQWVNKLKTYVIFQ